MDHTHILLIAAAIATALLVVLRWIFAPRRKPHASATHVHAPRAPGADGAWDGAARRRRDLAT
jgi:hypothetical protein